MAKHNITHSFATDEDSVLVEFTLVNGKVDKTALHFRDKRWHNLEYIDMSPAELVDLAATLNQAAEWVIAIGLQEDAKTPTGASAPASP